MQSLLDECYCHNFKYTTFTRYGARVPASRTNTNTGYVKSKRKHYLNTHCPRIFDHTENNDCNHTTFLASMFSENIFQCAVQLYTSAFFYKAAMLGTDVVKKGESHATETKNSEAITVLHYILTYQITFAPVLSFRLLYIYRMY